MQILKIYAVTVAAKALFDASAVNARMTSRAQQDLEGEIFDILTTWKRSRKLNGNPLMYEKFRGI